MSAREKLLRYQSDSRGQLSTVNCRKHNLSGHAVRVLPRPDRAYFTSRIVIAGLLAKKLCGISVKPDQWVGITGQSSIRVT
jgi:hypothetical protein